MIKKVNPFATTYFLELDNGLKVFFVQKKGFKKFYCSFVTYFGSLNDEYIVNGEKRVAKAGVAHFLEHKMFATKDGTDISAKFSELGIDVNAYTTYDATQYFIYGIKHLKEGINILLDFVQEKYFTKENVQSEKGIILQEYKMYLDDPDSATRLKLYQNMYENTFFNKDISGDIESIKSITKEDLDNTYDAFYNPHNMALVIVSSNEDENEIFDLIKENQSKKKFLNYNTKPLIKEEKEEVIKKYDELDLALSSDMVMLGIKFSKNDYISSSVHDFYIKLKIFFRLLYGGRSKNYQYMQDNNLISYGYSIYENVFRNYAHHIFKTYTNKASELIKFLKDIYHNIDSFDIDEEELELEKKAVIASYASSCDYFDTLGDYILDSAMENVDFYDFYKSIFDIKKEDIMEIKKYIKEDRITILHTS